MICQDDNCIFWDVFSSPYTCFLRWSQPSFAISNVLSLTWRNGYFNTDIEGVSNEPFHNGYRGEAKCQTCCEPFPYKIHQTPFAISHSIRPADAISVLFPKMKRLCRGRGCHEIELASPSEGYTMGCIPAQGSKCARSVGVTMVLQCCMLALHPFSGKISQSFQSWSHLAAFEQRKGLVAMLTNTSSPNTVENSGVVTTHLAIAPSPVLNSTALPLAQVVQNVDSDLEIKSLVCFKQMMLGVYIFCRFAHFCVCFGVCVCQS